MLKPSRLFLQHLSPEEAEERNGLSSVKPSPSPPRKSASRNKAFYDPFLLVPCRKFPSCSAVPFDVGIQSAALVVMDAHAHFSTTEVIGLLGGRYFYESRTLQVNEIKGFSLSCGRTLFVIYRAGGPYWPKCSPYQNNEFVVKLPIRASRGSVCLLLLR